MFDSLASTVACLFDARILPRRSLFSRFLFIFGLNAPANEVWTLQTPSVDVLWCSVGAYVLNIVYNGSRNAEIPAILTSYITPDSPYLSPDWSSLHFWPHLDPECHPFTKKSTSTLAQLLERFLIFNWQGSILKVVAIHDIFQGANRLRLEEKCH